MGAVKNFVFCSNGSKLKLTPPNQALPAKKKRGFANNAQQADGCQLGALNMACIGFVKLESKLHGIIEVTHCRVLHY